MQTQQKPLVHSLRQLLIHDLYAALPELHPEYEVQNDKSDESPSSLPEDEKELNRVHDPGSHNCAIFVHCTNSSELHLQGVALRSQYSDHAQEVVTLH